MADPWPVTLPQALLMDGNQDGSPDGRIKSQTDQGPGKTRRRTSAAVRKFQGRMLMTEAQLLDMRTFIDITTLGGSLPFNFPDPITGATLLVQFGDTLPNWVNVSADKYDVALMFEALP